MKITNELLAAYAEGKVSQEEREAVRQYLVEHPEKLRIVAIMMDEYFDMNNSPMDYRWPHLRPIQWKKSD